MPRAIDLSARKVIIELRRSEKSFASIARQLGYSLSGVRRICRLWRANGERGLQIDYRCCGRSSAYSDKRIRRGALMLKRRHPQWGAGFIWTQLHRRWPDLKLPSWATLKRWFTKAGLICRRSHMPAQPATDHAKQAHEVWQVDAKEGMRLANHEYACWLVICDERSGAVLASEVFPPTLLE